MTRATAALLAVLVAGCGGAPWKGHAGMGWRWKAEPTVGISTPELAPAVQQALRAWRYGRFQANCRAVDVCVTVGTAHHAGPRGGRCFAELAQGFDASGAPAYSWHVAAHEIGHCYGLPHSADPASVMCSSGDVRLGVRCDPQRSVTEADRERVRGLPRPCHPGLTRAAFSRRR